jgi:hypothetical protein
VAALLLAGPPDSDTKKYPRHTPVMFWAERCLHKSKAKMMSNFFTGVEIN